jgi:hypothetical protein
MKGLRGRIAMLPPADLGSNCVGVEVVAGNSLRPVMESWATVWMIPAGLGSPIRS